MTIIVIGHEVRILFSFYRPKAPNYTNVRLLTNVGTEYEV